VARGTVPLQPFPWIRINITLRFLIADQEYLC